MTIKEMQDRKRELGYTNELIAEKSGVPLGTVQKLFAGFTKAPRRKTVEALEKVLSAEGHREGEENTFGTYSRQPVQIVREPQVAYGTGTEQGKSTLRISNSRANPSSLWRIIMPCRRTGERN